MANPVFPTLALTRGGQDSKFYSSEQEDVGMKSPMEGGYVVSRAKHTRAPRKAFTTGYSSIKTADKTTLEQFYATVKGASVIFDWIDPVSLTTYQVRFSDKLSFKYVGTGVTQLWDVMIKLEQA